MLTDSGSALSFAVRSRADFSGGFDLLESDDPQALAEFALMWSDLMQLTIVPVLEDGPLSEVLQRIGK